MGMLQMVLTVCTASPLASPSTLSAEPSVPTTRAALRRLQQLTALSSPKLAAKKRRRSEMSNTSRLETPHSLNTRAKRQRKSSPLSAGGEVEAQRSPHTPCLKEPQSPPLLPCCTPKICPLTVTKRRAPLMTSAAQNCCTPTVCDLNVTYSLSEDVAKPGALSLPRFPGWENAPCALKKQEGPFVPRSVLYHSDTNSIPKTLLLLFSLSPGLYPLTILPPCRASIPVFSMKGSSIPKPSSISKGSVQKRRGAVR